MSDMPKEIWAGTTIKEKSCGSWYNSDINCYYDNATPYTLTSHHTAEIAKRDQAIEVLMAKLSAVRVKDITEEKSVFATLNEAQAILGEPFAATPEKGQVDVDDLAQFIRKVNGSSQMGAGVLAEHIVEYLHAQNMLKNPRKVNTSF